MAQKMLEEEDCHKVIEKFLKTKDFFLSKYEVVNFHNPFQGLVGEHFTLKADFIHQNQPQSADFFVKTLSTNPFMLDFSKQILVYEKEAFFYELLEDFETYNIDTSYAPKGLFSKPYVIVLADLSRKYKGTPKRKFLDLEHCEKALEAIAKFHASSIIYERKSKKSLNEENAKILEDQLSNAKNPMGAKWMKAAVERVFQLIDLILAGDQSVDAFKKKLSEMFIFEDSPGLITSLLHADLWTSNFLYHYEAGHPVDAKLLDFQMLKYGPVELDVVEFLMTNTSTSFRAQNFDHLVGHYYKKLTQSLTSLGLNIGEVAPFSEFATSCNNFKLAGKIHAVVDHSYTFMADEIYEDVMRSEQSLKKSFFEERWRYILESYNKNEEFKKVLSEDVLELRDLLSE